MIPIAKPIIGEEEITAVREVLNSGMLSQGKKVQEFESAFAEYVGTSYAVAVSSGTAALHIALLAHDIRKGDEVITTPFSFIATANSILFTGAKPIFADLNENTLNISIESMVEKITPRTKAILPVHLYGQTADMKSIMEIAEDHDIVVIEDACQAHGSEFEGKKAGSFATGVFSFYPTKNMTTGEGGMLVTSDKKIAEKARMLRSHGSKQRYLHEILGYNLRMNDVAAAIGIVQLRKLENLNKIRIKNATYLTESLKNIKEIKLPYIDKRCRHVFHQYTIRLKTRDKIATALNKKGIETGIYYPLPIHKQPLYKNLGYDDSLPVAEKAASEVLSLPVHPSVNHHDIDVISKALQELLIS